MRWHCFSRAMESHHRLYLLHISIFAIVKCRDKYHALDYPFSSHAKVATEYLLDAVLVSLSSQICPAVDL